jgi:cytochrome c biogenesis protein
LLVGALVGSRFGFEGYANIVEGERTNTHQLHDSVQKVTLPFSIQCDEFEVTFYEGGRRPKEFRSSLSIIGGDGRTIRRKDIRVNDPLRCRGINIFQSSYGETGATTAGVDPSQPLRSDLELNFHSAASGMIYSQTTAMGKTIDLPEGLGSFKLERYEPAAEFKGMAVGPSLLGILTPKDGPSETVLLPLNHPGFDGMRRGAVVISVANIAPTVKPQYYTGLMITKDPGVGLVYLGFVLMIVGCAVTFFMSHRRLVVEVQPVSGGVNVMVSGTANKNKVGFKQKIRELAEQLEKTPVKS